MFFFFQSYYSFSKSVLISLLGYGMIQACGHVDYFPNEGLNQPGCDANPVTKLLTEGDIYEGNLNCCLSGYFFDLSSRPNGRMAERPSFTALLSDRYVQAVILPIWQRLRYSFINKTNFCWWGGKQIVACSHLRAHHYFTESINSPCQFQAYTCDSYANFKVHGSCQS